MPVHPFFLRSVLGYLDMFRRVSSSQPVSRGPRGSRYLSYGDVRRIEHLSLAARSRGLDLNWMLTIRVPNSLCGAQGKRYVHNVTRALFQALRRRGSPSVAVTVYERPLKSQNLHAHVLVHIPVRCTDLIEQRLNPPDLHVRQIDDKAIAYVTKERWARPSGHRYFYERGDYIPGPRVSFTKDASALLDDGAISFPPPADASESRQTVQPSPVTLRSKLRSIRTRHGLTQEAFYGLIGLSRAHGANVEAGRYRLSRTAAQKALRVMQELGQSKVRNRRERFVAA